MKIKYFFIHGSPQMEGVFKKVLSQIFSLKKLNVNCELILR